MAEKFLTYGSACQDCGFNNQRIDLEQAVRLAIATKRTLVVRNFACSVHAPCPTSNASSDGVIAALGGVAAWRAACRLNECDVGGKKKEGPSRWGSGVHFMPAQLFVDPGYFRDLGVPFLWQDDFHARHSQLLDEPSSWVMLLRKKNLPLSSAERQAPVWHISHLHKIGTLASIAKNLPQPKQWPKVGPLRYAPWLQRIAQRMVLDLQTRHGADDFSCVHVRLGDWIVHNGLRDEDFQPRAYADGLNRLHAKANVTQAAGARRRGGKRVMYLATTRKSVARMLPALTQYFEVETSSTLEMARHITATVQRPTEDVFACVEQLVCIHAPVFVGTPGSTVTMFVSASRARANPGSASGQQTLMLSPITFVKRSAKQLSGQQRLDHVAAYWKQERRAGRAERMLSYHPPSQTAAANTAWSSWSWRAWWPFGSK